jgi:hypothetical protein
LTLGVVTTRVLTSGSRRILARSERRIVQRTPIRAVNHVDHPFTENKRCPQRQPRSDGVVNRNVDSVYQTDAFLDLYCGRAATVIDARRSSHDAM